MEDRSVSVDPVLAKLADWAAREALSREAVAKRLGVGRPTVAGWFLALEAIRRGDPRPPSARSFQFTNQSPEVQARIAAVLNQPLEALRAESTGTSESALDEWTRSALSDVAQGSAPWEEPGQHSHHIAAVAGSVPGVEATAVISVYRGRDRSVPYQYQVAVLVEPPASGTTPEDHRRRIKAEVEQKMNDAGLDCYWEYGPAQPSVRIRSYSRELDLLGSLAVPVLEAVRVPRTGMLVRNVKLDQQRNSRLGLVITPPYGASRPVAGWLSARLEAGHIPAETWRELAAKSASRHPADTITPTPDQKDESAAPGHADESAALDHIDESAALDTGFILHKVIHQLERGNIPGAWLVSMEAESPLRYDPLDKAITKLHGIVMVVRLSEVWQRLAAWRLAGNDIDQARSKESAGTRVVGLSNTEPFACPMATPDGKNAFRDHQERAARRQQNINEWERYLGELVKRRKKNALPTIEVTLEHLPDDLMCVRLDGDTYTQVHGDDRLADAVAFEDSVDPMMDEWKKLEEGFADGLEQAIGPPDEKA